MDGLLDVILAVDCRGGTEDRAEGGMNSEVGFENSRSISLDSSVTTTEEPPPPNSVLELFSGLEERTLSKSKPASAGSDDFFFDSFG